MANLPKQQQNDPATSTEAKQTHPSLREEIDELQAGIGVLKAAVKNREQHAEEVIKTLTKDVANLETKLKEAEEIIRSRNNEISSLKSQLQMLTRGIKEISSLVNYAQDSASTIKKSVTQINVNPAHPESEGSTSPMSDDKAVPATFFDPVTEQLTSIVGPMAAIILRDHIVALGESMEKFPESRLSELLEVLSKEISDEQLKVTFRRWFVKYVQAGYIFSGGTKATGRTTGLSLPSDTLTTKTENTKS